MLSPYGPRNPVIALALRANLAFILPYPASHVYPEPLPLLLWAWLSCGEWMMFSMGEVSYLYSKVKINQPGGPRSDKVDCQVRKVRLGPWRSLQHSASKQEKTVPQRQDVIGRGARSSTRAMLTSIPSWPPTHIGPFLHPSYFPVRSPPWVASCFWGLSRLSSYYTVVRNLVTAPSTLSYILFLHRGLAYVADVPTPILAPRLLWVWWRRGDLLGVVGTDCWCRLISR